MEIPTEEAALDILARRVSKYLLEGEVLDLEGAAAYLKMSTSTLYQKCCTNEIPHSKPGKRLMFLRAELADWVKKHHVPTTEEIAAGSRA